MANLNTMVYGTTPQEREIVLERNRVAVNDELIRIEAEKARRREYKKMMIEDIMKFCNRFTREQLEKKDIRTLERIYDYC